MSCKKHVWGQKDNTLCWQSSGVEKKSQLTSRCGRHRRQTGEPTRLHKGQEHVKRAKPRSKFVMTYYWNLHCLIWLIYTVSSSFSSLSWDIHVLIVFLFMFMVYFLGFALCGENFRGGYQMFWRIRNNAIM